MHWFQTGNGGNGGRQTVHIKEIDGRLSLKTCGGTSGGETAENGRHGNCLIQVLCNPITVIF